MSVNGKFKDFTENDLLEEANILGIGTAPAVVARVRAAVERWSSFAVTAEVSAAERERIQAFLLPLDALSAR